MRIPLRGKIMGVRKISLAILCVFFMLTFSVYMMFFKHGPPEEILAANRRNMERKHKAAGGIPLKQNVKIEEEVEELDTDQTEAIDYWNNFITKNNYVSIGDVYDTCDPKERIMIGRAILLPDKRWGGITSRTFINTTLDTDLADTSIFYIQVKYNGQDLFDNKWDFCTLDEGMDNRLIYCPIKSGEHSWVRTKKIPNYLPKGHYETKAWLTDQNEEIVMCGFSDFVI